MPRCAKSARRLVGACVAAILISNGTAAAATVEVRATGCTELDEGEVERLLGIELAFVASAPPLRDVLRVELFCSGSRLRISVVDPATQKPLEREVALGPPEPGRERTIALLASQLLLTSWAESFLARAAPVPPAPKETPFDGAERSLATDPSSNARGGAPPSWEVGLGAGVRMRDEDSPVLDPRIFVRPSVGVGRFRALLEVAYERGSTPRTGGTIGWSMVSGGVGGGWRSGRLGVVALEATATASVVWIVAQGEPATPAFVGDSRRGTAGEGAIAAGPIFFVGPVSIGLALETGVLVPSVTARSSGDSSVALGGVWGGASVRVGAESGAR